MRPCPYCAEQIQDAAVLCKHCEREIPSHANAASDATTKTSNRVSTSSVNRRRTAAGILTISLLVVVGAVVINGQSNASPSPSSLVSVVSTPSVFRLGSNQELKIEPGKVQSYTWDATPDKSRCHLSGHIEVVSGGSRDVQVAVMASDDFQNWLNGHEAKVFFQTDKITAATLDVTTNTVGPLVLAISNGFSVLSEKRVRTQGLEAVCR